MYHKNTLRFGMISAAIAALSVGAKADSRVPNLLDWKAMGGSGAIQAATPFTLKNVTDNESLRYGKRTWGINLVWDKRETLNNIRFEMQGASGDILYGKFVAIAVNGGGYLKYEKTRFGINLVYSTTPTYEWLIGGGQPGKPVQFGEPFALMSQVEHDLMIYGERPVGINLVWMKDFHKSTWDRIKGAIASELKQNPGGGPFLAAFLGLLL